VQQGEHPQRAVRGDQVEIGPAALEQRMSVAEVVVDEIDAGRTRSAVETSTATRR